MSNARTKSTFKEEVASTASGKGASLVGMPDAGNYWTSTTVDALSQELGSGGTTALPLTGNVKFSGVNTTGAGSAALGANSPATVPSAPYTWVRVLAADGTTCFLPLWK